MCIPISISFEFVIMCRIESLNIKLFIMVTIQFIIIIFVNWIHRITYSNIHQTKILRNIIRPRYKYNLMQDSQKKVSFKSVNSADNSVKTKTSLFEVVLYFLDVYYFAKEYFSIKILMLHAVWSLCTGFATQSFPPAWLFKRW